MNDIVALVECATGKKHTILYGLYDSLIHRIKSFKIQSRNIMVNEPTTWVHYISKKKYEEEEKDER